MAEPKDITLSFDPESLDALRKLQGQLTDELLRLECLKMSTGGGRPVVHAITDAGKLEAHVRYGRLKDEQGFQTIAPEAFADEDGNVISFKGENFYRACGKFIRRLPDGGTSSCVKRVDHDPKNGCEDYDGHVVGV